MLNPRKASAPASHRNRSSNLEYTCESIWSNPRRCREGNSVSERLNCLAEPRGCQAQSQDSCPSLSFSTMPLVPARTQKLGRKDAMNISPPRGGVWSFAISKVQKGHTSWDRTAFPSHLPHMHEQSLDLENAEDPHGENTHHTHTRKPPGELTQAWQSPVGLGP